MYEVSRHTAGVVPEGDADACGRTKFTPSQPGYKAKFCENKGALIRNLTLGDTLFVSMGVFDACRSTTAKGMTGTEIISLKLWNQERFFYTTQAQQRKAISNYLYNSCLRMGARQAWVLIIKTKCPVFCILDQLRLPTPLSASQGIVEAGIDAEYSFTPDELVRAYTVLGGAEPRSKITRLAVRLLQIHITGEIDGKHVNQVVAAGIDVNKYNYLKSALISPRPRSSFSASKCKVISKPATICSTMYLRMSTSLRPLGIPASVRCSTLPARLRVVLPLGLTRALALRARTLPSKKKKKKAEAAASPFFPKLPLAARRSSLLAQRIFSEPSPPGLSTTCLLTTVSQGVSRLRLRTQLLPFPRHTPRTARATRPTRFVFVSSNCTGH